MPFGAVPAAPGGAEFRLWAPAARNVALRLHGQDTSPSAAMSRGEGGWYSQSVAEVQSGALYSFVIDGELAVPDPASRFQPQDVHGPSELIDPAAYVWRDAEWRGRPWHETVLYELHVGTFSPEGTYDGVANRLDHLADLGVTAVELMPLAESPGARNWGYDGVLPFAPEHHYGRPEALKRLVDADHARGLMVFLDVVYNHFGPEGNYLHRYAPQFFTGRHKTPWGAAINFDGADSRPVRDFFIHNALYWLEEYHIDGLRLDAVHAIHDNSAHDILVELAESVRAAFPAGRHIHLVLENDDNAVRYLERTNERPRHYVAQWNDDIHHVLHVALTRETGGYYEDYADATMRRLGRALAEGFVYQGEASPHRGGRMRGTPSAHLPPTAFVSFLQNHDQVGNRALGERIARLAPEAAVRAAMSVVLLSPSPPLLFMGEEWSAPHPFPFFCDYGADLAKAVRDGRSREFAKFAEFADPAARARIPDPLALQTYESAILDWAKLAESPHAKWLAFYRALLAIRRREIIPLLPDLKAGDATFDLHDNAVLDIRWHCIGGTALRAILAMIPHPSDGLEIAPTGRLLYATPDASVATGPLRMLPPWFAAWYLESGPGNR
jgi:maltooligosyltrehalose trehalohydrolase